MAQFVGITIDIEGKSIKQFSSLAISQSIFEHHTFRLVCPTEAIDGTSGSIFNTSKNMIGSSISIKINSVGKQDALKFLGVITQIESARHSGHAGDIIIAGYSPTILLDNGPHCKTWEKKAVKNIAQDVLRHFPQNLLQPKISPAYGETLSYTVQYRETAWQFLCRLSAVYGEWFYYDGQKLILGAPQGSKEKLLYGSNLHQFNMALHVRPASFQMMAYDYMNHEVYDGSPAGIAAKAGLNDLGKHTLHKSEQFYGTKPKQWHNQFLTNKKQLDDFVNTRAAMQSSKMVRFNGSSGQPSLQLGGCVSIEGKNVFNQADESFGDYTIISLNHHCDGQGNYTNDFVAIPATVKMPPVNPFAEPHSETQSALVTDNNDPKGLGRVRVKFHWMNGAEKSPWIRVTTPHAGDDKGMFFIPETGEEVIVGFEGDSPTKPFIIGSVFHGKAKNSFANTGNDLKVFKTRSGSSIVLNDSSGSVFITDKDNNTIVLDGSGHITLHANASILIGCGKDGANTHGISIDSEGNIEIKGKKIVIKADDILVKAKEAAQMKSGEASFTVDGNSNGAAMKGDKATIKGNMEAKISGTETTVSGDMKVTVKGAIITLN
jgi:type VI secretion system secreted protein VgrG